MLLARSLFRLPAMHTLSQSVSQSVSQSNLNALLLLLLVYEVSFLRLASSERLCPPVCLSVRLPTLTRSPAD